MIGLLDAVQPLEHDVPVGRCAQKQPERDQLATRLLRGRTQVARYLADLIDAASLEFQQQFVRVPAQLEAQPVR